MMTAEQKRSSILTHFLGQFWRNFLTFFILYLILVVALLGIPVLANLQHATFNLERNTILISTIPLVLLMSFYAGWAGAMLKCNVRHVAATGAFGALIIAALSTVILFFLYIVAGNVSLGETISFPVVIFFASWLMIAVSWFVQGLWGGPEWS